MSDYVQISDAEIEVRDPGTTGLFARLRDNAIAIASGGSGAPQFQTAAFAALSVTAAKLATDAAEQAKIKDLAVGTSKFGAGSVTRSKLSIGSDLITNPIAAGATLQVDGWLGTDYYFMPQIGSDDGLTFDCFMAYNKTGGADSAWSIWIQNQGGSPGDFTVDVGYVDASPPYDLGDGIVHGFLYLDMPEDGRFAGASFSRNAPWAGCGEGIRADTYIDGKPYKRVRRPVKAKGLGRVEQLLANLEAGEDLVEITPAFKNRHMHERPQPWRNPRGTVVLLDPTSRIVGDLMLIKEQGENPHRLIRKGYIQIDNTPLARKGPPGVQVVGAKWKHSR